MLRAVQRYFSLLCLLALASGCTSDALYSYCNAADQCGSRSYRDSDDVEIVVYLDCVETEVDVSAGLTTRGNSCTLDCASDAECDSRVGLGDGLCVSWDGSDDFLCYQRCDAASCYPSSSCEEVQIDGEAFRVCLPNRS